MIILNGRTQYFDWTIFKSYFDRTRGYTTHHTPSILWKTNGSTMVPPWFHHGSTMVSPWFHHGSTMVPPFHPVSEASASASSRRSKRPRSSNKKRQVWSKACSSNELKRLRGHQLMRWFLRCVLMHKHIYIYKYICGCVLNWTLSRLFLR